MATEAILVVGSRSGHKRYVRIMTRHAGEAGISRRSPALAGLQTVCREPDIQDASQTHLYRVERRAMASSAKVHRLRRRQGGRIHYQSRGLLTLSHRHRRDVLRPWPVTRLATDSGNKMRGVKMSGGRRCGCVTTEAATNRIWRLRNPQTMIQVGNLHLAMTGPQIKSANSLEIAEVALVEHALLLIDVSLAEVAAAEHPGKGSRYGSAAIARRVRNPVLSASNLITVRPHS